MQDYKNIIEMENILDNHKKITDNLNKALDEFLSSQKSYKKSVDYYHSEQFQIDYDRSNNNLIDKDIKCGVLSQDAIYDLIGENFNTAIKMLEIATKIIKEH
ncbi:MAG: DUF4298 domain-containing protein [Tissierellia bacterium]|nr:DUF4298 domain-containing protein [Tissierellia bacterium]